VKSPEHPGRAFPDATGSGRMRWGTSTLRRKSRPVCSRGNVPSWRFFPPAGRMLIPDKQQKIASRAREPAGGREETEVRSTFFLSMWAITGAPVKRFPLRCLIFGQTLLIRAAVRGRTGCV